ncbi:MAG: hypothetical protein ACE360_06775 [Hyphomicrobiales bacterium]
MRLSTQAYFYFLSATHRKKLAKALRDSRWAVRISGFSLAYSSGNTKRSQKKSEPAEKAIVPGLCERPGELTIARNDQACGRLLENCAFFFFDIG